MKTPEEVLQSVTKRLESGWHTDVAGTADRWPHQFTLGAPTSGDAAQTRAAVRTWSYSWHDWAATNQAALVEDPRTIGSIKDALPTYLRIPDIDTAARLTSPDWVARISRARTRHALLREQCPTANAPLALKLADPISHADFALALAAARWFAATEPTVWRALTPRQVPIPGLHAKWLDGHSHLVKTLAGLDDLTMLSRPTRVYWTYLDPRYRRSGQRLHDSLTLGDTVPLAYAPDVVLIVENKDTAVLFPELAGGIVIEGSGNASVGLLPRVPWIHSASTLIYWGDIDQKGFEIVNGLRARMSQLRTILVDRATYETYAQFGTYFEPNGKPVKLLPRRPLPHLTSGERDMYENLSDPHWTRHRRFEQERVPLGVAVEHIRRACTS